MIREEVVIGATPDSHGPSASQGGEMATERLSMRKTREILRQKWVLGRSHREVRDSLGVSVGVVSAAVNRAKEAGLDWAAVTALDEVALETRLYGAPNAAGRNRPAPDFLHLHNELKRKGVTLELLHVEYLGVHPDGYRYSRFCDLYRGWLSKQRLSMRQVHRAGEKAFLDYSGKKPHLVDAETGELVEVELYVAVLGASSFTYVEATRTQRVADFVGSTTRALEYFGGVAEVLVPDQLRSAVRKPGRYEPLIQRTFDEMAGHYGTVVIPARPRKPKDKAKVEVAVQVAQRWILARMRDEVFHSLAALNERIWELLEELNDRPMRAYRASRRELYERLDKPALKPLPVGRFVYSEWKQARVSIDYHVDVDRHLYSVPWQLVREEVEVRITATTVEVYHVGKRVASHVRSHVPGRYSTVPEHMPKSHRKQMEWTPTRLMHWGEKLGPCTARLVRFLIEERPHPEQGYRRCLGILKLERTYGAERLEAACLRALTTGAKNYRNVNAILKNGLDRVALPEKEVDERDEPILHENIRGGDYYH